MANFFEAGSWIWIPDSTEVVLPAKVVNTFYKGEPGKVLVDGKPRSLAPAESAECTLADQQTLNPDVDNLTSLDDLNENSLLNILRERYNLNRIYSNIGSILVSVNPFKALPLYTPQQIDMYKEGPRGKPPHVFAVGHNAYYEMINERKNQSIIITGESGAGKSEACKLVLQFIADLSANHSGKSVADDDTGIEQQLLQANPILEAFGNAKTVRNNNSSRFGKLITVKFDRLGAICESTVVSYLLEKSRVVHQSANERNYHIFYELVAAAEEDPSLCAQLRLDSCEAFAYLSQSGVTRIEGVVDENDFDEVCNAMDILNFEESSQMEIWKIVAAILHFGNVKFTATAAFDKDETARIINTDTLNFAAGLIGINAQTFSRVLTQRILSVGKVVVPYKVREAMDTRDAMVKTLYALMFEWIIRKINMTLEKNAGSTSARNSRDSIIGLLDIFGFESFTTNRRDSIIGLLDIFGFESFTTNSFEQLCINYCNEKLNNHFNEHVFKHELAIYVQEGVSVRDLSYKDNMPILEFLENGHNGIYSMMDEQIMVNGTDDKFLSRVQQIHSKSPQYVMPTRKNCTDPEARNCFGVLHYAGEVFYNVRGFLDKNRDALHPDVIEAMQSSKSQIVSEIFQEDSKLGRGKYSSMRDVLTAGATSPGGPSQYSSMRDVLTAGATSPGGPSQSRKGKMATGNTLGKQFRAQLDALMVTLNATDPHYIRCMKPNNEKRGSMFKSQMMLQQLRYSGLLEVCRIRKMGYPIRRTYDEFFARYQVIHPSCATTEALLAKLTAAGTVDDTRLLKGNTKILMKQVQANDLDVAREVALQRHVIRIQGVARGFLTRRRLFYFKRIMAELRAAMKARDENKLVYWLSQADELPNNGQHFPVVQEATTVLRRLEQESKADELPNNGQHFPVVQEATTVLRRLEQESKVVGLIMDALLNSDLNALLSAIDDAKRMQPPLQHPKLEEAERMKDILEEERQLRLELRDCIEKRDIKAIDELLARAQVLGIVNEETKNAKALKARIEEEGNTKLKLREAGALKDLATLNLLLARAAEMGIVGPDVDGAREVQRELNAKQTTLGKLADAAKNRDMKGIIDGLAVCEQLGIKYSLRQVEDAKKVRHELQLELDAVTALQDAMDKMDLKALEAALGAAEALGLSKDTHPELGDALSTREALKRKQEQDAAKLANELKVATLGSDSEAIAAVITRCMAAGMATKYAVDINAAKEKQRQIANQSKAKHALELALRTRSLDRIEESLVKADACGLRGREVEDASIMRIRREVEDARIMRAELARKRQVFQEIQAAMQAKDMDALGAALREAEILDMEAELLEYTELQEMKNSMNREEKIAEVKAKLSAGVGAEDLQALNKAMAMAIELGCEGDVDAAKLVQKRLTSVDESRNKIQAASRSLGVKIQSRAGISSADLEPLSRALNEARADGLSDEAPFMIKGVALEDRCLQQLEAQAMLTQALASLSKAKMRDALEFAEELELELEMMIRVRRALRRIEVMRDDDAPLDGGLHTMSESDIEQFRAERDKRHAKAGNPKYKFQNYPRLRSRSDYARGTLLYKRREQEKMLCWQNTVANKSLTDLDKDLVKEAIAVRKSLLGYMGDKQMAFPETLAQNILFKGLDKPKLRDEAYLQIMKQLTDNPKPESAAKGWQVLCMCCGTFLPSMDFENYLLNFVLDKSQSEGAEACYARYCLHTLEGMMSSRTNEGIVPTLEEIQAYKERPPILATIELVNGALLTEDLPIAPDLNVKKVLEICAHFGGLQAARTDIMGMFVYDLGPIDEEAGEPGGMLPFTPTPLRNEDYMGDQFIRKARQRRDFKFVYKRKIALHSHPWPSQDAAYNRLVYLQAEDDVIRSGTLEIDDQSSVVLMSAIAMAMDLALEGDAPTDPAVLRENVTNYIPPNWKDKVDLAIWTEELVKLWPDLISKDRHELEIMFVEQCRDRPMYGSHFFYATKVQCVPDLMSNLPKQLLLAFNADGMQIFNINRKDMLQQYTYADVHSWRGTRRQVSLTIWDQDTDSVFELALKTQQAQDMAAIILDHINAIMNNNGKN